MAGRYPILFGQTQEFYEARRTKTPYPSSVPYSLVEGHEEQAIKTHSQSLGRLAERGGLSPKELWCVVHDVSFYSESGRGMTEAKAIDWLRGIEDVAWATP